MLTASAWAPTYPAQLGFEDFTSSVAARTCAAASPNPNSNPNPITLTLTLTLTL